MPKDSARVTIPGCSKGYAFTAGPRTPDHPGTASVPEGMHFRMNGPKKLIAEIKSHEGAMIEITGLVKKSDLEPEGVGIGGLRIRPGRGPNGGGVSGTPLGGQVGIDVEGWKPSVGSCRR